MPQYVVCKCEFCRGYRRHEVVTTARGTTGPTTRVRVCPACETATPFGICCPDCGDCRLPTTKTSHRDDAATLRIRQCRNCGRKVRTRERLYSATA